MRIFKILVSVSALFTCILVAICVNAYANEVKDLFNKGRKAYNAGNYEEAIKFYEETITKDPNFAEAYNALGIIHRNINSDLSTILWYFKKAVELKPDYAEACDNLGRIYYTIGDFERAEEYEKKAISINPNMSSPYYALAWIYLLGKPQPETSIFYFKKILDSKEIPFAYYGLGLAYLMNNERAPVLEVITKLRSMDNDKLAIKLEDMLRESDFYMPPISQPLVSIRPPVEAQEQRSKIPKSSPQPVDLGGKTMKIRLKGKLVDVNNIDKEKAGQ